MTSAASIFSSISTTRVYHNKTEKSSSIKVYPNPATHQLSFEFDAMPEKDVEISIYSAFGQRVMHRKLSGSTKYVLDISSLNAGLYFYSVISDGKMRISDKFVKQ